MVGVIVLNYNNTKDIRLCVDSLIKWTDSDNFKLLIVDNGSETAVNEDVKSYVRDLSSGSSIFEYGTRCQLSKYNYLRLSQNVGYARGNNAGLEYFYADSDITEILILNSDIILTSDIVTPLVARLYEIPDVGSVSPILYKLDGEIDYCCARRSLCKKDMLVTFSYLFNKKYKSALEKRKILRESPELINQDKIEIDLPSGSCMLFKKAVFEALGGFDDGTFLYYEEDILNKKSKKMGLKNVLIPSVSCIHVGGATTNNTKSAYFLKKCNYESLLYYLQKYESCTRLELCYYKLSARIRLVRLYFGKIYHSRTFKK